MHTDTTKLRWLIAVALAVSATTLRAQTGGAFNLGWSSINSGGGTCVGGIGTAGSTRFTLAGTVGQLDAGECASGAYTLQGGFLSSFQKISGPKLRITRSLGAVIVTWPAAPCGGFHLEASANVPGGPWVDFGEGFPLGSDRFAAVATSTPYQFFRLRKGCAGGCPRACRE